jgi:hypothetical protein
MRSTGAVVQPGEGGENARKEGRTLVFGSCKWLYSYRRFLYQGGTHYVFFEVRSLWSCAPWRVVHRLAHP